MGNMTMSRKKLTLEAFTQGQVLLLTKGGANYCIDNNSSTLRNNAGWLVNSSQQIKKHASGRGGAEDHP